MRNFSPVRYMSRPMCRSFLLFREASAMGPRKEAGLMGEAGTTTPRAAIGLMVRDGSRLDCAAKI